MSTLAEETIAAVATPPGCGGIGIVRVSGPAALEVGGRIFQGRRGRPLCEAPPFFLRLGIAADPVSGEPIDEVLAVWMPAGRSYTGEPTVEFHAHGGRAVLEGLLRAACASGARRAVAGEFTKRAFLSGRIDLSRAEAVADLIAAESEEERRVALRQLRGAMADRIEGLRARLVELLAASDALLDFGDEDGLGDGPSVEEIAGLAGDLRRLAAAGGVPGRVRGGPRVVFAGRTNAGKSSLFNVLLDYERSLVHERPGTTRDYVSEPVILGETAVTLIDTAGLRRSTDPVEVEGIARSRSLIDEADVLVLLVDGSAPADAEDLALIEELRERAPLVVLTKMDLPRRLDPVLLERECAGLPILALSARSRSGLHEFVAALTARCRSLRCETSPGAIPNARHQEVLLRAAGALDTAAEVTSEGRSLDLAAAGLREALSALDEITGRSAGDEILERIFERFCVGK